MLKIVAVVSLVFVLLTQNGEAAPTSLQVLPEREGYVPVYIRNGDTPLVDINFELAEAFRETNNIQTREAKSEEGKLAADQTPPETKPTDESQAETKLDDPKAKRETPTQEAVETEKSSTNEEQAQQPPKPSSEEKPENARKKRDGEEEVKPPAAEEPNQENDSEETKPQKPSQLEQNDENRPRNDDQ